MAQVCVKYNPYRLETQLMVNGREVAADSGLYKITKGKRLQEWIGGFPKKLREELNTMEFSLEFCGMDLDWDDFKDAFEQAKSKGVINFFDIKFITRNRDDDITEKIVQVFTDLRKGPIPDFRDPKLLKAFDSINNSIFPINVIATMSSGKSTLINALIQTKLMPARNEACTATITEILDTDGTTYTARVYDEEDNFIKEIPELTYKIMEELNGDADVHCICVEGNIPFLNAKNTALMLVDTPGPNNAQNQAHMRTTYRAINNDSNSLVLYVLNGTQLSTSDDAALLRYVANQMKRGGKQVRDRFLFVINKMDLFDPDQEDVGKAIESAKRYLATYGIEDPQLFPCSAYTALNIRTILAEVDVDNMTIRQRREHPKAVRDTLDAIDTFITYESMHFENYSTLSPSAQQELNCRLSQAIESGDEKEQALIHSGICSIEAAIAAYVKKYAKTKKIKDLVETFQEVLESSQALVKAKTEVATNEQMAKACAERAAAVKKKLEDGREAKAFQNRIMALDPMPNIIKKADQLKMNASSETSIIFRPYGETICNRSEARNLVKQFSSFSINTIAELTSELESVISKEIVETSEQYLREYQEKLLKFDDSIPNAQLDFKTVDLVKGALSAMRETAQTWSSDAFAAKTVQDVGNITYKTQSYWEKVGQREERVVSGQHQEKIGTRKVQIGEHSEKVGTRRVRQPRKGLGRIIDLFSPKYGEEDVYETVPDYRDEDIYETVIEYKTVTHDEFKEKEKLIEQYRAPTTKIQQKLIAKMSRSLDDGIDRALNFASEQVEIMKQQFSKTFEEVDRIIEEKYDELEKCANDQSEKEEQLKKNQEVLAWIQENIDTINSILEI